MAQLCVRPKGDPHCPFHPKQNVILRCKDCPGQTLVCQLCITSIHEGHKFGNIQDDITEKIANIQQFITKKETLTMPQLVAEISSISKKKKTTSEMFQSEIQAAREQAEKLRELVDLHMTKIVSSLESDMKDTITSLDHYQRELKQSKSKLEAEIKDTKQTLASDSNILILDVEADIMKRSDVEECIPPSPDISVPQFKPCKNPLQHVENAFGDLEIKKTTAKLRESKAITSTMPQATIGSSQHQISMPSHVDKGVKSKVEHQTRKLLKKPVQLNTIQWRNGITSVCTTPNSMAWVCTYQDKRLDLINDKGEVQKTLTLDTDVYRICIHPDTGDLYGYCKDKNIIHINIQSKGTAKTTVLFHTDSKPYSIACTSNNVIVGMDGKVCMYTYKGQLVYSKDIGRYYTAFYISVCNRTNRIAVACGSYGVLVLDNRLQELYRYKGEGAAAAAGGVKREMFYTFCAVYDDNGYLLVGGLNNKEIHILDDTAKYISTIKIKEVSMAGKLGAGDGVLWVGCNTDPDTEEYRLVIIKYMD